MKLLKVSTLSGLFTDLLILAGIGMLFYGLHLVAPWIAFAVVGVLLFIIGAWMK